MNNRLDELLSADHQARWKAILVSGLVAAAVGMVSEAALKRPASDSQTWAAIAGFVAFAVQVLYYCLRSGASVRNSRLERIMRKDAFPLGGSMRAPRRMFVNAAAAAASVLVFVIGTPLVEGAVIDDRLRKLVQRAPLNQDSISKIDQTLDQAAAFRVKVSAQTIALVRSVLTSNLQSGGLGSEAWRTILSLASYRSTLNDGRWIRELRSRSVNPERIDSLYALHWIPGEGPGEGPSFDTAVVMPPVPKSEGAISEKIGEDLNPDAVRLPQARFVRGGSVILDGFHMRNIIYVATHVAYNGSPVILENVTFINCRFSIPRSANGERLVSLVTTSDSVSFRAD